VGGAEVLAADGGGGAAGVVGEVLEALVEVVGALDVGGRCRTCGVPPSPGAVENMGVNRKRPGDGSRAFVFLLSLVNSTGLKTFYMRSKCIAYVADAERLAWIRTDLGA